MIKLALLAGLFVQQYFVGSENLTATSKPKDVIGLFQRVCVAPFAEPKGFQAAIVKERGLERIPDAQVSPAEGGLKAPRVEIWHSDKVNVHFVFPDGFPIEIPVPQCRVTGRLDAAPDAKAIGAVLAKTLKAPVAVVPNAKLPDAWDIAGGGRNWRVFLTSAATPYGNYMSLEIINIRD